MNDRDRPTLLVLSSTYPRFAGDPEPAFVHELCRRLVSAFDVIALVPDAPGADASGIHEGVEVVRYRYAPRSWQTLVNDGGIMTNLRRNRWKFALVPPLILAQWWRARHLLRTRRIDVVHAHWLIPQGLIGALLRGAPRRAPALLVTSHGADLFALRGRVPDALKRFVVRRANAVTVVSPAMKAALEKIGADTSRVEVRSMGVDLSERFVRDEAQMRSTDEILFVGRLVEKKGLKFLIEAMPRIIAGHPAARLTVAGFGPEEPALRARVAELGLTSVVDFVGAVSQADLPVRYRRAAVLVAPFVEAASGDQEGLGLVVVEALGCGCPVVLSDLPATREILPGSSACTRVPPGDGRAIADAVAQVLRDPSRHRSAVIDARPEIERTFDWAAVARQYTAIIDRALAAARAPQ